MEIILHLIASPNDLTYQCIYVMHPVSQVGMKRQDGSFRLPMVTWGCVIVRCVQYVWVCRLWGAGMSHMSLFVWDVKCIIYINWRMGCHPMLFIYLRRLPWILSTPFFFLAQHACSMRPLMLTELIQRGLKSFSQSLLLLDCIMKWGLGAC